MYALFVQADLNSTATVSDKMGWFMRERFDTLESAKDAARKMARDPDHYRKGHTYYVFSLDLVARGTVADNVLWDEK